MNTLKSLSQKFSLNVSRGNNHNLWEVVDASGGSSAHDVDGSQVVTLFSFGLKVDASVLPLLISVWSGHSEEREKRREEPEDNEIWTGIV